MTGLAADVADREFSDLLDRRDVRVVFQPVVDLRTREIVGLEALARGPEGSAFEPPLSLFAAARRTSRVAELDWVCRAAAFRAFQEAELPPAMSLFVNVEPETLSEECPPDLAHFVTRAESVLRVFVEVNDRALEADPAGVLYAVDRARDMGWGIALDDIGGSRAPVAMLPIVRADVLKLDLRLLNRASPEDAASIITSVLRYVEAKGAALLVEGIESKTEARWARALGAAYGQGMYLGAPGPLHLRYPSPSVPVPMRTIATVDLRITSPFALFERRQYQRMDGDLLARVAAMVAHSPRSTDIWPVFLAGVGRDTGQGAAIVDYIHGLPLESLLFVMFGTSMPAEPAPGVRGVRVRRFDRLADERFLIVLSDQGPVALFARAFSDELFDVAITQDPDLVHRIAHHLIRRVPPLGPDNTALPPPQRGRRYRDGRQSTILAPRRGWRDQLGLVGVHR